MENRSLPQTLTAGATIGILAAWDGALLMRFVYCGITPLFDRFTDAGLTAGMGR